MQSISVEQVSAGLPMGALDGVVTSAAVLRVPYSADVLTSPSAIERLADSVQRFTTAAIAAPRFFLASLSAAWAPRVVVVRRGADITGIVYGKERRLGSFSTGIVYGDGRLGNLVVAADADREDVITVAIARWFASPGVRAVRLAIVPGSTDARAVVRARRLTPFDVGYCEASPFDAHARLPLARDFEVFLRSLGPRTRHNFRYYRRKFAAAGGEYSPDVSLDDFAHAAADLRRRSRIPVRRDAVGRALTLLRAAERPWAAGLRDADGRWLSIAAGWSTERRATLFLQLNSDRDHEVASLSVVLRANLIEDLIRRGIPELLFWSGVGPPLSRYTVAIPAMMVHLDTPAAGWRLVRSLIGKAQPWLPKRIASDLHWMASARLTPEPPEDAQGQLTRIRS